jgi:hypothetical protein
MAAERALVVLVLLGGCVVQHKLGNIDLEESGNVSATGTTLVLDTESTGGEGSTTSTTGSDGTAGSEVTTGAFDPYAQCGVVLEYGGPNALWTCGCMLCNLDQEDLTEQSRSSFLGACECLCDAFGCGGSTSVTTGTLAESSGGSSSGDEGTTTESTGDSSSGATETTSTGTG